MSAYVGPRRPERTRRFVLEGERRPSMTAIATHPRRNGELTIAVLKRPGSEPIVTLQFMRSDGSQGGRTELRIDELGDLETAIAVARGAAT